MDIHEGSRSPLCLSFSLCTDCNFVFQIKKGKSFFFFFKDVTRAKNDYQKEKELKYTHLIINYDTSMGYWRNGMKRFFFFLVKH